MREVLSAENLSVGYDEKVVLSNLNFKIYSGDFICLMGSNGRGKTTLLKTICNLIDSISGNIFLNGKKLEELAQSYIAQNISLVLTERLELPNSTVHEVVSHGRAPYTNFWGTLSDEDNEVILNSLDSLNIRDWSNRQFDTLSDGQKQKVLIARALAQDTPILFLDEPTNFLDIPHKMELMSLLKKVARKHDKAIFFTSHDWDVVLTMCSLVWAIDSSGKIHSGMPEELVINSTLDDCFFADGIKFSTTTGRFEETFTPIKKVAIDCSEIKKKWLGHALKKEYICIDPSSPDVITYENDFYVYKSKKYTSLFELIYAIKV